MNTPQPSRTSTGQKGKSSHTGTVLVLFGAAFLITVFEVVKQLAFPTITHWQSHVITDAFGAILAAVAAFVVARRYQRLHRHTLKEVAERTAAEEVLRHSEERYRSLFTSMTEGFALHEILCDDQGESCDYRFLEVNPAFERLTGLRREDVVGRTHNEVLPGDNPRWVREYGTVALTGEPARFESYSPALQRHYEVYAYRPARRQFAVVFTDVTERKRAEAALRESEERFRRYFELGLIGMAIASPAKGILEVNDELCRILGYARAELLRMTWAEMTHPDDLAADVAQFNRVLAGEIDGYTLDKRWIHKDGRVIHGTISVKCLRRADGSVDDFVVLLQDITERVLAEEQVRRHMESLTALYAGAQKLAESLDSLKLAQDVAQACVEAFGLQLAWLVRAEPDGSVCTLAQFPPDHAYPRQVTIRCDDTPEGRGAIGQAIRTGAAALVDDPLHDPRVTPWLSAIQRHGFRSGAAFPLTRRDKPFGALMLCSERCDYFSAERVQFFQSYALLAAAALENARLFEETERRLSHVRALHRIDVAIASSFNLRTTLDVILDQTTTQLGVDAACVLLYDPQTHRLSCAAGRGFRTPIDRRAHLRLGESVAGRAVLERRTLVDDLDDLDDAGWGAGDDPSVMRLRRLMASEGFAAYVSTPLIAKGQVVGVLEVFHRATLDTDGEWLALLETLAGQMAIAIDSAGLFERLQRSNDELALAYDATLEGWSRALDLRDRETEGHTRRVTDLTVQLARAMGLDEAEIVHLRRGALLHDIGKMGIPDDILLKPGPLTEAEWAVMRRHPQYAYDMLSPIWYLRPALDIPYGHHEKWDGSGYPRGLKGEQIPLAARVFAVADVYDALRSDRPYRKACPEDRVRDHIRSQAGTHFDPQVVEAFLNLRAGAHSPAEAQGLVPAQNSSATPGAVSPGDERR